LKNYDVIIIGGGAAGFFAAINLVENAPHLKVAIIERGKEVLTKLKISGGGRCNVTHACFDPLEFTQFYPRGSKELRGPFNQFCAGDTIAWFENRGVILKIEEDGRMFPETNLSQTIIDCFLKAACDLNIDVIRSCSAQDIFQKENSWKIDTNQEAFECRALILTTGSNPKIWNLLEEKSHKIIPPVASLFTFNSKDARIKDLMGISAPAAIVVKGTKLETTGPLLITHWGISGPGVLRLSAWGARELSEKNYQFHILVNWLVDQTFDEAVDLIIESKLENSKKTISKKAPFDFPNRLWERLVQASDIPLDSKWADLSKKQIHNLALQLTQGEFHIQGKSTFKEEFVTAGGIDLKEVNFKTMESKLLTNLFFAGEILNVDAITGGFNFQNAWTTGFIAAREIAGRLG